MEKRKVDEKGQLEREKPTDKKCELNERDNQTPKIAGA